ncbi:nuclear transport factor 2 family protein [Christiangramia forsetii]|uniref:Secreted protein n=2 Tax=Christiangramia forsetii TaxID=411153 RepID=A0M011_CHRFK|nr:nuclear transport factor 2 family protein [Christiangramia forsetii]GGG45833.1 hypothetical protein GCM10011532_32220 [Christiangramia forsetii]CAL65956.1 secreted protein [Christiangramia forsetii KT0803]
MKKLIIIALATMLVASCNNGNKEEEVRYSQDSEEINTFKAAIQDYEKADWEAMKKHYADTAQVFHNTNDGKSIADIIKGHKEDGANLSSYSFIDEENEYEMVLTDDGNTWVNFWGDWKATLSGSGKEVIIPVHLTAQFENGKIAREHGYWDNSIMIMAMQETDSLANSNDPANSQDN